MSKNIGKTKSLISQFFFNKMIGEKTLWENDQFKLSECKSIAFVYDEQNSNFKKLLDTLQNYFKRTGKVISFYELGVDIISQKMINYGVSTINFYSDEVNFYGKPKSQDVLNFAQREFDLLINMCDNKSWSMRFIMGMSNAKFKVATFNDDIINYDLSIPIENKMEKEANLDFLVKILDKINNNVTKS